MITGSEVLDKRRVWIGAQQVAGVYQVPIDNNLSVTKATLEVVGDTLPHQ